MGFYIDRHSTQGRKNFFYLCGMRLLLLLLLVLVLQGCRLFSCNASEGCFHFSATTEEQQRALERGRDDQSLAMGQMQVQDLSRDSAVITEEDKSGAQIETLDSTLLNERLDVNRIGMEEMPLVLLPTDSVVVLDSSSSDSAKLVNISLDTNISTFGIK